MAMHLFLLFTCVYANSLPNNIVQINKFDFSKLNQYNRLDVLKKFFVDNLILASDNLKKVMDLESDSSNKDDEQNELVYSNYGKQKGIADEPISVLNDKDQKIAEVDFDRVKNNVPPKQVDDTLRNNYKRFPLSEAVPLVDQEPGVKIKRQAGGGGSTQMVIGTFQAMMKPMSMRDLPSMVGSQNQQMENEMENDDDEE